MPRITHFSFPELRLAARDAHKLRGYFGTLFEQHSPLLHNHLEGGGLRYAYPLVQYKVIDGLPVLVGLNEGAELLIQLFLEVKELVIDDKTYALNHKDLRCEEVVAGYGEELRRYDFGTLYMALNQENYPAFVRASVEERKQQLNMLVRNHILAAFKGMGVWLEPHERIMVQAELEQRQTLFKNQAMVVFAGGFTSNAILPKWVGLGKAVSRGFGAVE